jgi:hypothetical protein
MPMHATNAGEKRKLLKRDARELARDAKALQKAARIAPEARQEAHRLQEEADKALTEAQSLKPQARLEDLQVWQMEKVKSTKKGSKTYTYWMASWREGDKVHNVHLGSCGKISQAEALEKARAMKANALAIRLD